MPWNTCFPSKFSSFSSKYNLVCYWFETSLLRSLQVQTLPDATPPIGKSHTFSKITVTFEPIMQCWRILCQLGNGRLVGHHNGLMELNSPRSQSTMERIRSSEELGVLPVDRNLRGTVSTTTSYFADFKRLVFFNKKFSNEYNQLWSYFKHVYIYFAKFSS